MKKVLILFFFSVASVLMAQDALYFSFIPEEKYRVIQRSDYRIKVNGVYKGHIYNENRGILKTHREEDGSYTVSGKYYVFEELSRDGRKSARQVNDIYESQFSLYSSGQMIIDRESPYPLLRSFPNYTIDAVSKGDSWLAFSEVVIPRGDQFTVFPVYCEYTYDGQGVYGGEQVHNIRAKYAVRYREGEDYYGDESLKNISGTHDVSIIISAETGEPILYRDQLREIHSYVDGGTLEKNGFSLTFFKGVSGLERGRIKEDLLTELQEDLGEEILEDINIKENEEGIVLSLDNLHFLPDQAQLLPDDIPLLDSIASYLKGIEGRSFLVKGHTADVGSMESQFKLSIERAEKIVRELTSRGIEEDRFLYMGLGGTDPLYSNDTDEGRAGNRRVEIIIMED